MRPTQTKARQIPAVLLLHGWGGSYEHIWQLNGWHTHLEDLGYRVIGIDLPGHGKSSTQSHEPKDYADMASHIEKYLPDEETPLFGIGYSLGAKILLELATRKQNRFERLILGGVGGNIFNSEPIGEAVIKALKEGCNKDTPAAIKKLVDYGLDAGNAPLALAACLARPTDGVMESSRLSHVTCPVLLVCGDQDSIAYPVSPLANALQNSETIILKGVDHLSLPSVEEFSNHALTFLKN